MKRIAYIELDTHAEIAASFMEVATDLSGFSVDYYFSQKIIDRLGIGVSQNIFRATKSDLAAKIAAQNYDLVIIGTAHRFFNVFNKISCQANTAVIVHNINFSKTGRTALFGKCFAGDQIYRFKLLFTERLLASPHFHRRTKKLVLDGSMATNSYHYFPIFFSNKMEEIAQDRLTVVVPGTVSQMRRDYHHVFSVVQNFKSPLHLILLGKASGAEVLMAKHFEKNKPNHIDLKYFNEKVSAEEFAFWMRSADVLWCPVRQQTKFFDVEEFYGKTKMSGNIGDAVTYSKIAVFSKNYVSHYNFIKLENDDVEQQLISLKKADNHLLFKDYGKETVAKKLSAVLHNLL